MRQFSITLCKPAIRYCDGPIFGGEGTFHLQIASLSKLLQIYACVGLFFHFPFIFLSLFPEEAY